MKKEYLLIEWFNEKTGVWCTYSKYAIDKNDMIPLESMVDIKQLKEYKRAFDVSIITEEMN